MKVEKNPGIPTVDDSFEVTAPAERAAIEKREAGASKVEKGAESSVFDAGRARFENVANVIGGWKEKGMSMLKSGWGKVSRFFGKIGKVGKEAAVVALSLPEIKDKAVEGVKSGVERGVNAVKSGAEYVKNGVLDTAAYGAMLAQDGAQFAEAKAKWAKDKTVEGGQAVYGYAAERYNSLRDGAESLVNGATERIRAAKESFGNRINAIRMKRLAAELAREELKQAEGARRVEALKARINKFQEAEKLKSMSSAISFDGSF
ncbi:MAG: hypothetical protein PHV93_01025 [Candidatus Pacebacteria bacterium]|nr:hypothetical protein [Candidatus Paceibacterota bacterium]